MPNNKITTYRFIAYNEWQNGKITSRVTRLDSSHILVLHLHLTWNFPLMTQTGWWPGAPCKLFARVTVLTGTPNSQQEHPCQILPPLSRKAGRKELGVHGCLHLRILFSESSACCPWKEGVSYVISVKNEEKKDGITTSSVSDFVTCSSGQSIYTVLADTLARS